VNTASQSASNVVSRPARHPTPGPGLIRAARREGSSRSTARLKGRKAGAAGRHGLVSVRLTGLRWKSARRDAASRTRQIPAWPVARQGLARAARVAAPGEDAPGDQRHGAGGSDADRRHENLVHHRRRRAALGCDSAGSNCAAVADATARTFALGAGDVGSTMRVRVRATNLYAREARQVPRRQS
jgi:hypothetical protein